MKYHADATAIDHSVAATAVSRWTSSRPRCSGRNAINNGCIRDDDAGRLLAITQRRLEPHWPPWTGPSTDCVRDDGVVCSGGIGMTFRDTTVLGNVCKLQTRTDFQYSFTIRLSSKPIASPSQPTRVTTLHYTVENCLAPLRFTTANEAVFVLTCTTKVKQNELLSPWRKQSKTHTYDNQLMEIVPYTCCCSKTMYVFLRQFKSNTGAKQCIIHGKVVMH